VCLRRGREKLNTSLAFAGFLTAQQELILANEIVLDLAQGE
jgi:hypothetical protein